MIDLKINNLYIEPGLYGWTLHKKRMAKDKKTGEVKEVYDNISYHGELLAAVREAWRTTQRDRLREKDCDLADAVRVMQETQKEFLEQMREIKRAEKGGYGDE